MLVASCWHWVLVWFSSKWLNKLTKDVTTTGAHVMMNDVMEWS